MNNKIIVNDTIFSEGQDHYGIPSVQIGRRFTGRPYFKATLIADAEEVKAAFTNGAVIRREIYSQRYAEGGTILKGEYDTTVQEVTDCPTPGCVVDNLDGTVTVYMYGFTAEEKHIVEIAELRAAVEEKETELVEVRESLEMK